MRSHVTAYFIDGPFNGQRREVATSNGYPPTRYTVAFIDPAETVAFDVLEVGKPPETQYAHYQCHKLGIAFCNAAKVHYIYTLIEKPE